MSFTYWLEVHDNTLLGRDALDSVLNRMAEFAFTFSEWQNIFYRATSNSVLERTAFLQMATRAKTFGHWLNVYCESFENDVVKKIALAQLMALADAPADALEWTKNLEARKPFRWMQIANFVPKGSEEEAFALEKFGEELRKKKERKSVRIDSLKI